MLGKKHITLEQIRKAMILEDNGFLKRNETFLIEDDPSLVLSNIQTLKVHEFAKTNPSMDEAEQKALIASISEIGQQEPIIIWRNFIIDGRNRFNVFKELGLSVIIAKRLPHKTAKETLMEIVETKETRRHQTKTQIAIRAFKEGVKARGMSQSQASLKYGVSQSEISRVGKIYKELGSKLLDEIFVNKKVKLANGRYAGNLKTIISYINELNKNREIEKTDIEEEKKPEIKDIYNILYNFKANGDFISLAKVKQKILELEQDI